MNAPELEPKKLDVWISERLPEVYRKLKFGFESVDGINLLCNGIAPGYWNLFAACHPALYEQVIKRISGVDGVYVNEYPPEIQSEIDREIIEVQP